MKRFMILSLAACVLAFGVCSSAFAIRFRLDPELLGAQVQPVTLTNLLPGDLGSSVPVAWQSCSNAGIPTSFGTAIPPYVACLALNNLTGKAISALTFQFVVPTLLAGQTFECSNDGTYLAVVTDCPTAALVAGQTVSFGFAGLPPIPSSTDFFLGASADGLTDPSDFPTIGVTASVPEPAELGMFGFGLALIAVLVVVRRRRRA